MRSLLVAVGLLTLFPVRFRKLPDAAEVARSRFWFPPVGLLLGGLLGGWTALLLAWLPSRPLAAFLVLLAWVAATGALHLDGFCDLCDGLFGGRTPEDRLRILKDPRRGAFALTGCVLLLLGKFVALQELLTARPEPAPWVVAAAVAAARSLSLCVAAGARYPRAEGTGKVIVEATRGWEGILYAALAALVLLLPGPGLPVWVAVVLTALLGTAALRWACRVRLGGITGDCLGAAIELNEWAILTVAAGAW